MTKTPREMIGSTADKVVADLVTGYVDLHLAYAATQAAAPTAGDDLYGLIWTVMHIPAFSAVQHLQVVSDHVQGSRVKFPVLFGRVMLLGWRDTRGGRRYGTSRSRVAALDIQVPVQLALVSESEDNSEPTESDPADPVGIIEAAAAKNLDVIMIVVDSSAAQLDRIAWGIPRLEGDRVVLNHEEMLYQAPAIQSADQPRVTPRDSAHSDGDIPERVVRRRSASSDQ